MQSFGYREHREIPRPLSFLKNRKLSILLGVFFVTILLITFSNKGLLRRILLERELHGRESHVLELKTDIAQLKHQCDLLRNDQATIEHVARESHGMIRLGEVVYRVRPAATTQKQ